MGMEIRGNQDDNRIMADVRLWADEKHQVRRTENKRKSIFAGEINLASDKRSVIEQKKKYAQKQAMKLVGDAWENDKAGAKAIDDMRSEKSDEAAKLGILKSKIRDVEENKKAIQQEYGIAPDSQEQKDLELLEKYQNNMNGSSYDEFSDEEIARLKELQNMPRTEYQNKVLEQNAAVGALDIEINRIEAKLMAMTQAISDAKIEREKSQEMLNADDAADKIMEAAEEEAEGMLIQEGMDNIDEAQEEEEKKAEEAAEKKEEQEEKIEKNKENSEEMHKIIKEDMDSEQLEKNVSMQEQNTGKVEEAQKSIQKLLVENNLINEDLLGIEIDLNF